MARVSIRILENDTEVGRIDADLPAEALEVVAACQEWVDDWKAAGQPMSEEEGLAFEEAFARQFGTPPKSLEERMRAEQALAERMLQDRRRAEAELKALEGR